MTHTGNPIADLSARLFQPAAQVEDGGFDNALWQNFVASGLEMIGCPDEDVSLADTLEVLKAAGRAAVQIPIAETILARWLGVQAGWDDLGVISTVLLPPRMWNAVPWGRVAQQMVSLSNGELSLYDGPFEIEREAANLAGEPRDAVRMTAGPVRTARIAVTENELLTRLALFKAAMTAGAMDEALQVCVDHAQQRVQFGRAISQFQAVQQMLAVMAGHTAASNAAVQLAATHDTPLTAAIAKARTSEAVAIVTDVAHQVAGAMGFTAEFPLHRLTKRLWAWRDEAGDERYWSRRIGAAAIGHPGNLWEFVSSPESADRHASERTVG